LTNPEMDICDQIRRERTSGSTRCGVVVGRFSIGEAARAFGLADESSIYRSVSRREADAIAAYLLQTGLAYGRKIMSSSRATYLWKRFLSLFDGEDVEFFTNSGEDVELLTNPTQRSWTPATCSTFDIGVLVIGPTRAGCLWAEDED
jgi:hypothetical protein